MPSATITEDCFKDGVVDAITLVHQAGLVASRSEARRAIQQGGVTVAGDKVNNIDTTFERAMFDGDGVVVKKGKKTFCKVSVK